jgi:hypothetical protein
MKKTREKEKKKKLLYVLPADFFPIIIIGSIPAPQ